MKGTDLEELSNHSKKFGVRVYWFFFLLIEGIQRTELVRRAAALTYTTILSIFPLLAIIGFTASFFYTQEKEKEFMGWIQRQVLPSAEAPSGSFPMTAAEAELIEQQRKFNENVEKLFTDVSNRFRQNAGGAGVFGFIGLLLTCGLLYWSIESVVNLTWQTDHRSSWSQTFTNFITVLVFAPIIISLSITGTGLAVALFGEEESVTAVVPAAANPAGGGVTPEDGAAVGPALPSGSASSVAGASGGTWIDGEMVLDEPEPVAVEEATGPQSRMSVGAGDGDLPPILDRVRSITRSFGFLLPVVPMLVNALVISIAYTFIPRTRVRFRYALLGGFVTAILWEIARSLFFFYVYSSVINRTLADVLGVSVIFLLWIYITWVILLVGNLVVYTSQNLTSLWAEKVTEEQMLVDGRLMVAIMVILARRFASQQGGGCTEGEIRSRLGLSTSYFTKLIERLLRKNMVSTFNSDGYQLGRPADLIRVGDLLGLGCDLTTLPAARRGSGQIHRVFHWLQLRTVGIAGDATLSDLLHIDGENRNSPDPDPEPELPTNVAVHSK